MRDRSVKSRSGIQHRTALVAAIAAAGLLAMATPALAAGSPGPASASGAGSVKPNATGELDCNGYSPIQKSVRSTMLCTDLRGLTAGRNGRFYDNGWYIGHDEPDLRFLSSVPGSGDNVTWTERLGVDPAAAPTVTTPGHDVTHYLELTAAPWFSMAMCDPQSYPQNSCTPLSDANAPAPSCLGINPACVQQNAGGGSAFMELQFYPPGFAPFADSISCDNTHWCAALNIDSLECTLTGTCNPNCEEPVNFAFIQTDGVPTGPPSPQLADLATFTPNRQTLLLNPGDVIQVHMFDARAPGGGKAFTVLINDLTTHQRGFMQASAANGFMNSSPSTCNGTPFNFQPEYSTASADSIVPWAALQVNISTEFEIGHFEPCSSVTGPATLTLTAGVTDTTWQNCMGAYENTAPADGGQNPEFTDTFCYPQGDTHGGLAPPNVVTGCTDSFAGDVDFNGTPYWPDWPASIRPTRFPSTFLQQAPTTVGGGGYSQFQFQTDVALSESTCAGPTGSGCSVPPPTAPGAFYPYWTQLSGCTWGFGNVTSGGSYGRDAQYGTDEFATIGYPEFESRLMRNTCA